MDTISKPDTSTTSLDQQHQSVEKKPNEDINYKNMIDELLKSIELIQNPNDKDNIINNNNNIQNDTMNNHNLDTYGSSKLTTNFSSSVCTTTKTNLKRNSDGFDRKELKINDLETNNENKRHSKQLINNYASVNSFPLDSPSKTLARAFSVTNSRPSFVQLLNANVPSYSSSKNSGVNPQETGMVPPSPHYSVRKHNLETSFPSPVKQQQDDYDQIQNKPNSSYKDNSDVEEKLQKIIENPEGYQTQPELEILIQQLIPEFDRAGVLSIIDSIRCDEYGNIKNNVLISFMENHITLDSLEDEFEGHPINNIEFYENGKNSLSKHTKPNQQLQDEVNQLKKEPQIYKDKKIKEADIKIRCLYLEIERLEKEILKFKVKSKNREYQFTSIEEEYKHKVEDIEKESLSKINELENKLKEQINKNNSLTREYENLIIQIGNVENEVQKKQQQKPHLYFSFFYIFFFGFICAYIFLN
ncbi:hypothetical protein DICPUDRAFT_74660 [Dictyostelium purpureum]|uniref:Uncharacterized protein n=1 Tax=Dictyostelium purpureum TaxID=5786 RepID=F0Z8E1_DICPU|nr:uncharacterized protein DICPUDRAFT_74660 [Dictyostelium purpureum]EGC39795.1 hypothetical protein DICPUDRAFT_74660 [Dictyostelium purpureum]|eukprot:XP_003283662.1 hypothetical protein DICPUDRAFT_74660 [Dictyostelium purpureum]